MLIVVLLAGLTGCAQEWKEYRSNAGGYSVEAPGTVTESADKVSTAIGTITFHTAVSEGRTWGYASAYADFPDWVISKDHKEMLTGARDGALHNVGGKLEKQTWIKLEGHQGLEIRFSVPDKKLKAKARIYLVKNRLYQVIAAQSEEGYDEAALDRYLESFRLRPVL